jgi:type I restriction enzyme M protein
MNLLLHGVNDFKIHRGDTLRSPAFHTGDALATFDCVIANPPFSLDKWGHEQWASDPYGRNFAGMPLETNADYAWVQHMVKSMDPKSGRMAVVLPHGVLFRGGKEGEIRKKLLGMDILDSIIGLGSNLFYGATLSACVLIFRQRKPKDRKGRVLFIDASKQVKVGRAQNEMLSEHIAQIESWYRDFKDVPGTAKVVTLEELNASDGNLNISRFIEAVSDETVPTVEEAMAGLRKAAEEAFAAEDHLIALLKKEGFLQ